VGGAGEGDRLRVRQFVVGASGQCADHRGFAGRIGLRQRNPRTPMTDELSVCEPVKKARR
jgi:hypothetical protein